MDNKKLKTKILRWLCAKFNIVKIGIHNGAFYYTIQTKTKLKKSYLFLKNRKFEDYDYIYGHEHLDELNTTDTYEIKSLKPWQILDSFLDESSKGYSIYVLQQNPSFSYSVDGQDDEVDNAVFIKRNSSLESLAIEMDLNNDN